MLKYVTKRAKDGWQILSLRFFASPCVFLSIFFKGLDFFFSKWTTQFPFHFSMFVCSNIFPADSVVLFTVLWLFKRNLIVSQEAPPRVKEILLPPVLQILWISFLIFFNFKNIHFISSNVGGISIPYRESTRGGIGHSNLFLHNHYFNHTREGKINTFTRDGIGPALAASRLVLGFQFHTSEVTIINSLWTDVQAFILKIWQHYLGTSRRGKIKRHASCDRRETTRVSQCFPTEWALSRTV